MKFVIFMYCLWFIPNLCMVAWLIYIRYFNANRWEKFLDESKTSFERQLVQTHFNWILAVTLVLGGASWFFSQFLKDEDV